MENNTRCGYVAIVGRPNVGKSTLLNAILDRKVSITSHKAQTTRHKILGIKTSDNLQVVYVDTPGIHQREKHLMNHVMNNAATSTFNDVDVMVFVIDARRFNDEDEWILEKLMKVKCPVILVLNKVDLIQDKTTLFPVLQRLNEKMSFAAVVPLSAAKRNNLEGLEKEIKKLLPESPHYFPADQYTDRPESFWIAELVREKILQLTSEELPYSATVTVEKVEHPEAILDTAAEENSKAPITKISAVIWVERDSQKAMMIGKGGDKLRSIGQATRLELEEVLGQKVFLSLYVKVKKNWTDNQQALQEFGVDDLKE